MVEELDDRLCVVLQALDEHPLHPPVAVTDALLGLAGRDSLLEHALDECVDVLLHFVLQDELRVELHALRLRLHRIEQLRCQLDLILVPAGVKGERSYLAATARSIRSRSFWVTCLRSSSKASLSCSVSTGPSTFARLSAFAMW